METFNATCRHGEMVLIDEARYGRMKLGRCVTRSYGHLGCAADVRSILDARCSGRRACQFIVPDPTLYTMQPCPGDFTSYLETTYSCVEGCFSLAPFGRLHLCVLLMSLAQAPLVWICCEFVVRKSTTVHNKSNKWSLGFNVKMPQRYPVNVFDAISLILTLWPVGLLRQ